MSRDPKTAPVPKATSTSKFDPRYVSLLWAPPEQAAEFARIHATVFPEPWTEAAIAGMLNHPGSVAMMAMGGDPRRIGGFVLAQVAADEAEILTIAVEPAWQRHGIGAKLVDGAKRAAARAGARSMFLEVAASNVAACRLYTKGGFTEAGRRQGYYARKDATAEDALVLRSEIKG